MRVSGDGIREGDTLVFVAVSLDAPPCQGAHLLMSTSQGTMVDTDGATSPITLDEKGLYDCCVARSPSLDADFSAAAFRLNVSGSAPPSTTDQSVLNSKTPSSLPVVLAVVLSFCVMVAFLVWRALVRYRRSARRLRDLKLLGVEIEMQEDAMTLFVKDSSEPIDLRAHMMAVLTTVLTTEGNVDSDSKFSSRLRALITGEPQDAALGYIHYMRVPASVVHSGLLEGLGAVQSEFERYSGEFAEEARECMHYILFEGAGSSSKTFQHGLVRDAGRNGEKLADFVAHPDACMAQLGHAHVAALRIYTTAAYKVLNAPLRDIDRTHPHPFPVTVAFLREAIGKLRAVGAKEDMQEGKVETRLDLFRGMRDTEVTESFMRHGGTE